MGIPQHFLQDEVLAGYDAIATRAHERGVEVAIHTHVNAAQQVTPLVGSAVRKLLDMGYRDVRNQGVLLKGVNTTPNQILELCFTLLDRAKVMPYYFYMCDMIPNSEHWRLSVAEAQELQFAIMGYLPGFATPRFVCDVPFVGKRWVHMLTTYDRVKGVSYWRKNYRTGIEYDDPRHSHASTRTTTRSPRSPRRASASGASSGGAAGQAAPARLSLRRSRHAGRRRYGNRCRVCSLLPVSSTISTVAEPPTFSNSPVPPVIASTQVPPTLSCETGIRPSAVTVPRAGIS